MRILHVCTYDNLGGVARAAIRLHQGMMAAGYDSHFLCVRKNTDILNVHQITKNRYKLELVNKLIRFFRKLVFKTEKELLKKYPNVNGYFTTDSVTTNFLYDIRKINPDIIHIHWINELCRIEDVKKIKIPIVWNLHDASVFTGGCHVINDCTKYQTHCGNCPVLNSKEERDLSYLVFERKKEWQKLKNINIVSSSNWMAGNIKISKLFKDISVKVIPTGIDTTFFDINDIAQKDKNNSAQKKVILFGANAAFTDKNKGFGLLSAAINENLKLFNDCEIWVFGTDNNSIKDFIKIPVQVLGFPKNEMMPEIFNKVDITVIPSFQECFGQVTIESMSCGTPVVAFAATGLLDTVDHLVTGYLAKPYDSNEFAKGIRWVLDNNVDNVLGLNGRKRVVEKFEMKKVVEQNIEFYKSVLNS